MLKPFRVAGHRSRGVGARLRRLGVLWVAPFGLAVWAQTGAARDPADAAVPVPRIVHTSPLPGPAAARPARLGSWREANDLTGRIGGWRAYAREAQERAADAPVAPRTAPPVAPAAPSVQPPASAPPMHKH